MSIMGGVYRGTLYLVIVQNKAEPSNSGFERGEGICRFLGCTEDQFRHCRCSGLPCLKFVFTCSIRFTLIGIGSILNLIWNGGAAYVIWRTLSETELKMMLFTYCPVPRCARSKPWMWGERHRRGQLSSRQHCLPLDWVHLPPRPQPQPRDSGMSSLG